MAVNQLRNRPNIAEVGARVDDLPVTLRTRQLSHVLGIGLSVAMALILAIGAGVSISGLPDRFAPAMIVVFAALCLGCAWFAYASYKLLREPTKLTIARGGIRLENWKKRGGVNWADMEAIRYNGVIYPPGAFIWLTLEARLRGEPKNDWRRGDGVFALPPYWEGVRGKEIVRLLDQYRQVCTGLPSILNK